MNPQRPRPDGAAGRPFFGALRPLQREVDDFEREVLRRSHHRLVLAEFWAPWCQACGRLRDALEALRERRPGAFKLVSVNIEMQPATAASEGVRGLPLVKAYWRGFAVGEVRGVLPEAQLEEWLDSLVLPVAPAGEILSPEITPRDP